MVKLFPDRMLRRHLSDHRESAGIYRFLRALQFTPLRLRERLEEFCARFDPGHLAVDYLSHFDRGLRIVRAVKKRADFLRGENRR